MLLSSLLCNLGQHLVSILQRLFRGCCEACN